MSACVGGREGGRRAHTHAHTHLPFLLLLLRFRFVHASLPLPLLTRCVPSFRRLAGRPCIGPRGTGTPALSLYPLSLYLYLSTAHIGPRGTGTPALYLYLSTIYLSTSTSLLPRGTGTPAPSRCCFKQAKADVNLKTKVWVPGVSTSISLPSISLPSISLPQD